MRILVTLLLSLSCAFAALAEKKVIAPPGASARMFSPGMLVDGTLYVSGHIGEDPKTRAIPEKFEDEVKQCLENIGVILKEAGMTYADVVSVQVFLTDPALFRDMNSVYTTYFKEPRPARTTVAVRLASEKARIEISVIARK
jgi:2-iminobutanoate/2-iminopropanoate deaminase